jgi:hypothetical protein
MAANVTVAAEDRIYTCDVALLEIGGTDILGLFTNCSLRVNFDMVNAFLPHDINDSTSKGFIQNRTKRKQWSVELGTVVEKVLNSFILLELAIAPPVGDIERDRGQISVEIWRPGGTAYTGLAVITEAAFTINMDSVMMQSGTLMGYGPLVAT